MHTWVEVEDAAGTRFGALHGVQGWTSTAQRNAAGSFSFTVPASERAELLQLYRTVKCYRAEGTALQLLGAGIVESVVYVEGEAPLWQVSGGDLLRELAFRNVDGLRLLDQIEEHPAEVYALRITNGDDEFGDDRRDLLAVLDGAVGDLATGETLPGATAHPLSATDFNASYLYVRSARAFTGLRVTITSGIYPDPIPAGDTTLAAEYWNSTERAWQSLPITSDETDLVDYALYGSTYHHTLAISGALRWEAPSDWGLAAGEATYKVRLKVTAGGVPTVTISDLAVLYDAPTAEALTPLMAYAPPGWTLDAEHGYTRIGAATEYGEDLIVNGGFEESGQNENGELEFTGWTRSQAAGTLIEVSAGQAGSSAVKLTTANVEAEPPRLYQDVSVAPGTGYRLSAWARGDGLHQGSIRVQAVLDGVYHWISNRRDTLVTGTDWTQITYDLATPAACATLRITLSGSRAQFGACLFDGVTLRARRAGEMYRDFRDTSVLAGLISVAEQSGEAFCGSPSGRQVLWLGRDQRVAPVRAIGPLAPGAAENPQVCRIVSLQRTQAGADLCSRLRPTGGGSGEARVTLAQTSRAAPAGYAFDAGREWLINTTLEAASGQRIERVQEWPEVRAQNATASQRTYAADQLFDRALEYLSNHTASNLDLVTGDAPAAYAVTLAGCRQVLRPGWLLPVVWSRRIGDRWTALIEDNLYIQSATVTITEAGAWTTAVTLTTVPMTIRSDAQTLAEEIRAARQARAYG